MVLSGGTVTSRLVRIGYWGTESGWPDPSRMVDAVWDPTDREIVSDYLRRGFVARAYLGRSTCRICGEEVGSLELSDGEFIWPEGLSHYVEAHSVRLPGCFVAHVERRVEHLETAAIDEAWWRSQTER